MKAGTNTNNDTRHNDTSISLTKHRAPQKPPRCGCRSTVLCCSTAWHRGVSPRGTDSLRVEHFPRQQQRLKNANIVIYISIGEVRYTFAKPSVCFEP